MKMPTNSYLIQCSKDTCDMSYRVLLAGATGETGRLVLDNLLKDERVSKVHRAHYCVLKIRVRLDTKE